MKKYIAFVVLALLLGTNAAQAQRRYSVYGIGFYNLENLFDTCHDAGKNDYEYLPDGTNKWTGLKYSHKLKNMAKVLAEMGTDWLPGVGCAAIGVAEVENAKCLTDLCDQAPLKARNFKFVHIEGPISAASTVLWSIIRRSSRFAASNSYLIYINCQRTPSGQPVASWW